MNPSTQRVTMKPTQALRMANVAIASNTVGTLCSASDERQFVIIENTGLSSIWLGVSSNVTVGATGTAFGTIATGSVKVIEGFGGALYGTFTGLSHATAHVVKVLEY